MLLPLLSDQPADPLLSLIGEVAADTRPERIDLTVGMYRNASGQTPVMKAVKLAEGLLLEEQDSKGYLGPDGDLGFAEELALLALDRTLGGTLGGMQTPGGTGAIRLAADLIAAGSPRKRIWVGQPSWANHAAIFEAAGLEVVGFQQYDRATGAIDPSAVIDSLQNALPGDAVLLQACCHNPTGADPDPELWRAIAEQISARNILPLVDMAYHGLGDGMTRDAMATRLIFEAAPQAMLAYSCDKNFGLYRERVGAIFVQGGNSAATQLMLSNLVASARANYSMPPDHGAAVVRTILRSHSLRTVWRDELSSMRQQIVDVRKALGKFGQIGRLDISMLTDQKGMFSLLPLANEQIRALRRDHSVYMAGNGRINLAGLARDAVPRFAQALGAVQQDLVA